MLFDMQNNVVRAEPGLAERPWLAVATVCLGAAMAAIDASIINVSLPTMQHFFHTTTSDVAWVSLTYLLVLTTIVVLAGRLADGIGRSRMYRAGFLVFGIASAGCGFAPSLGVLLVSRLVQGVGAAMLQANSVAIVTSSVPSSMRGRAIGVQGAAQAVGLAIGPAIGGLLIAAFSWRAIFLVNLPIAAIALIVAPFTLPKDPKGGTMPRVDVVSSGLMAIVLVLVLLALNPTLPGHRFWYVELGIAVVLGYVFARRQGLVPTPLVDPQLVKILNVSGGVVLGILSFSVLYGVMFLTPYYLQEVRHLPAASMGLLLMAIALAMTAVAPLAGTLADRFGNRKVAVGGLVVLTAGAIAIYLWTPFTAFAWTVPAMALIGVGAGVFTPPNNSSVMGSAPPEHLGVTGGLLNMGRSIGMSLGQALVAAIFEIGTLAGGYYQGFRDAMILVVAISIVSLVMQWFMPKDTGALGRDMPFLPD